MNLRKIILINKPGTPRYRGPGQGPGKKRKQGRLVVTKKSVRRPKPQAAVPKSGRKITVYGARYRKG